MKTNMLRLFVLTAAVIAVLACDNDSSGPAAPPMPQSGAVLAGKTFEPWEGTIQVIQGTAVEVGAGPKLWGLSATGGNPAYGQPIVRFSVDGPPVGVGGLAAKIESSPEGVVYVTNAQRNIFRYENGRWTMMSGLATDISVGRNNDLWVLGVTGHPVYGKEIWNYTASGWKKLPGFAARISVALDGTLFVVNGVNQLYRYDGKWELLPGLAQDVAARSRNEAWVVEAADGDGTVWHMKEGVWRNTGVAAKVAAVDNKGAGLVAAANGTVLRLVPPAPPGFRFVVMGDSRGEGTHINADVLGRIKDRIVQLDPLPEAVFVPGDLVDSGGTDAFEFWLWFLGPIHADPPGKGIPIYPQVGNHDVWSKNANYTQPAWQNVFDLPVNGPYGYEELAYYVEIGDALFISIDTCYWDGEEYYYNYVGGEQLQWIENLLSTTGKTYKFVFGHSPAYPQTEHTSLADNRADRDAFWNLLQRHDVSAYYCGHIHSYGRWLIDTRVDARWTNPVQQVLTGSCGAPLRGRIDVLGDVYIEKFHFAVVDIDETGAHHTVIDVDGNVIDEFHIAP